MTGAWHFNQLSGSLNQCTVDFVFVGVYDISLVHIVLVFNIIQPRVYRFQMPQIQTWHGNVAHGLVCRIESNIRI